LYYFPFLPKGNEKMKNKALVTLFLLVVGLPTYLSSMIGFRKTEKSLPNTALFKDLPTLETERLIMQPFRLDHAQGFFDVLSDDEVTLFTLIETHQTLPDTHEYIKKILEKYAAGEPAPWGVFHKKDNALIGYCGFYSVNEEGTGIVIYGLAKKYWRQGLMTEALKKVIECGFTMFNFNRIATYCVVANTQSARVMEKAGMTHEGTLNECTYGKGGYWSSKVYEIIKSQ
jgi:ribosomal-protein-alanine N-acetyltransferase